jgi:hypothetical protein
LDPDPAAQNATSLQKNKLNDLCFFYEIQTFSAFNFDADSDPNPDPAPTTSFTHDGKSEIFFSFIHSSASLHCFIFLVSVIGVTIFNILEIKFVAIFW